MRSVIFVAILFGGVAGGLSSKLLSTKKDHSPSDAIKQSDVRRQSPEHAGLVRRIAALEQRISRIEERPIADSRRALSTNQPKRIDTPNVLDSGSASLTRQAPRLVIERAMEELVSEESPLRQAVSGIIQDEMKNRMEEWRAFRTARGEARDEERVEKIERTVGLKPVQKFKLLELLKNERSERRMLRREARDTMDFKAIGQKRRELSARTDAAAAEFLNEEQQDAWQESRKFPRRRR